MAQFKISELPSYGAALAADLIPIVDVANGATKNIRFDALTTWAHATISDPNTKTVGATGSEYAVTFADNDDLLGVTHTAGDSKIYVPTAGDYLITVSALVDLTQTPAATFDLWVKVNGQNLAKSNTQIAIPNASTAQTLAVSFILDLGANEYFELFYHASSTKARMPAIAAQDGPPVIPACPSVILTVCKVSN
jgi:hypothetical protein